MTSQAKPTLQLLGGIAITQIPEAAADRLLSQGKVVGALAYLSLAPEGRFQRRDKLVGLLWPELTQSQGRAALRKAVLAIRTALGKGAIVDRGTEELRLDREHITCDAQLFVEFADGGRPEAALGLYAGDLMPAFYIADCTEFVTWLDAQRTAFVQRAAAATWALAVHAESTGEESYAGRKAREMIAYDWSDERILRRAMTMLQRIGDHVGAIKIFQDAARKMREQLEMDPSAETLALVEAIKKGRPVT